MNHYRPLLLRVTASGSAALGGAGVSMQLPHGPVTGGTAKSSMEWATVWRNLFANSI